MTMSDLTHGRLSGRTWMRVAGCLTLALAGSMGVSQVTHAASSGIFCDPTSGNCYEYVFGSESKFWEAARDDAFGRSYDGMPGHLLTITSAEEQQFIASTFPGFKGWLGAYQPFSDAVESDPSAGWRWVTGEPYEFMAWACLQPDDFRNVAGGFPEGEDFMEMILDASCSWSSRWNDAPGGFANAYFVEYEPADQILARQIDFIAGLDIVAGLGNSLTRQLNNIIRMLSAPGGNEDAAIDMLDGYIDHLTGLRGTQLTTDDADQLIRAARAVRDALASN